MIDVYCSARRIRPADDDRHAVVGERDRAGVGELAHLGELARPCWPRVIAARKPTGMLASRFARLDERSASVAAESTTGSVFGIARIAQ